MTEPSNGAVPDVVVWEATRACRFACRHCRAEAQPEPHSDQLRTEEVRRLLDDIASFAKPILIVSGGDAMLREDLLGLISHATSRGLRVALSLSGRTIDRTDLEKLRTVGVRRVSISLDGANAKVHDSFRGVQGAFDQAMECIRVLRDAGMPFQVNTTISRFNYRDMDEMRDMVQSLGATTWDLFFLVPTGRATAGLEMPREEYARVLERIVDEGGRETMQVKVTCAPQYVRMAASRGRPVGRKGCLAGRGFCFVSHTGEVYGCGFLPVSAGNVRKQDFRTIYQDSDLFRALRDGGRLGGRCGACGHGAHCGGCRARALAANGDVLGEDPSCVF